MVKNIILFPKRFTFYSFCLMLHIFIFKSEKDYPAIKHSHDIWHAPKDLGKKLLMASPGYQKQTFSHAFFSFVLCLHILVFIMEQYVYQPSFYMLFFFQFNFHHTFNCQCRLK